MTVLVFSGVVIADSWFRWATYQYRTFDLAFYVQAFWLTLHGGAHSTLLDVSLMGNHAEPICYLLVPLFWLFRHPMFFVVVQACLVATMPFTGYRIAQVLGFPKRNACWLALATIVTPASGFMVLHEFHPETLAAPILLLMLEARLRKQAKTCWFWFLLALGCKENIGIMLVAFCLVFGLLDEKRGRRWQVVFNVIPGLCAAGWVACYLFWLRPVLNAGRVDYDELYAHLGGISGLMHAPGKVLAASWNAVLNGNLLFGLLIPCGFLPLLRPRWLVISTPILAQHLLSSRPSEWTIYYHYAAPLVPLFWYATAEAAARIPRRNVVAGFVLLSAIVCQIWIGPVRSVAETARNAGSQLERAEIRSELLETIPSDASIVAGLPYLSHLATRERLYSLHHLLKGLRTLSRAEYVPPSPTDAVLIDAEDSATFDRAAGYDHPTMRTVDGRIIPDSEVLLERYLAQASWRHFSRNEMSLLLRGAAPQGKPALGQGTQLDAHHRLVGAQFAPPVAGDSALILIHLEMEPQPPFVPWASLFLHGLEGRDWTITKGPIGLGRPAGQMVTDAWAIRRPVSVPAGTYRIYLRFYDHHEADFPSNQQRFESRAIDLGELQLQ